KGDDKRRSITTDFLRMSSISEATHIVTTRLIPTFEEDLDDLRALEPNDDIRDEVNSFFYSLESGIKDFKNDPAAMLRFFTPLEEAASKAQAFGFQWCGDYNPGAVGIDLCDTVFASSLHCGV